ncbi:MULTISPECIES: hypothetical protein [Paenibacillus]|uniref:Transposase IS4-like domain-containing protein n=1 Tax=Paenibacillus borealis TaxID=160799 RepID=A0ABX3GTR7_PAEBO|nr:hypothetical protein [Paenibacillus borealis]OMD36383.1 hypothetical protein BSK56_32190 [Paenibacillus borealis]
MDSLSNENGITYVFDRGYLDYGKNNQYSTNGVFFVTRLKDNVIIETKDEFDVAKGSLITRNHMVKLGQGKKQTTMVFRLIETTNLIGNPVRILIQSF